ncbi:MAG: hypothetical protein K6T55_10670 [Syntrophobacterales bacterium]|nr:hypothetical protein [Syntrophobacterales bacterium]
MILSPAILALLAGSGLTAGLLAGAAVAGVPLLTRFDLTDGSERQLRRERRTYLISTCVAYAAAFELLSLFLFLAAADRLHPFFVGAMCAAGTLNAHPWGYPSLLMRLVTFLLAGLWLLLHHADSKGYDYPLLRLKYGLLPLVALASVAAAVSQTRYFLGLTPEVITSCCGALFSAAAPTVAASLAALPPRPVGVAFAAALLLLLGSGMIFLRRGRGGYLFAATAVAAFPLFLAAFISWFCLYFYELPTHHCPFCVLQREYGYVGYPLFLALLGGAVTGGGVGVLLPYRQRASLAAVLPRLLHRLVILSLGAYGLFAALCLYRMWVSPLRL